MVQCDMAMNQSCYAPVPKFSQKTYFFYLAMLNAITVVKGVSKSGVFDNIIVDTSKIISICFPGECLIRKFNDIAQPLFEKLEAVLSANATLIRDLLLLRLISSKLSVEDLDIQLPPSMREEAQTHILPPVYPAICRACRVQLAGGEECNLAD